jgi:hypothetical protein
LLYGSVLLCNSSNAAFFPNKRLKVNPTLKLPCIARITQYLDDELQPRRNELNEVQQSAAARNHEKLFDMINGIKLSCPAVFRILFILFILSKMFKK